VVIFDEDARLLEQARQGGACAYISKHIEPAQLAPALHQAAASEQFLSLGFPAQSEPRPPRGLTNRELAILKAVAAGQTNKQIAAALFVTEQTVKFHLTNIYRKLDLRSRTDAARFAYHHGLAESSYLIPDVALTSTPLSSSHAARASRCPFAAADSAAGRRPRRTGARESACAALKRLAPDWLSVWSRSAGTAF
jgi:DNA-binding CsgD family transcriptional regulator